jgi:deoxyhypusine synthase
MIKVEKKGNTTKATEGSIYVLVDEFQTVLHALYHMLDKSIKESESVTTRDFMHSMVEDVVQKESEMNKA